MAKSSTKRKPRAKASKEQVQQIQHTVEEAVQYVSNWQRREFISLAMNDNHRSLPVCIPLSKDTYVVGSYGLKRAGRLWQVTSSRSDNVEHFSRRSTAVIYLLCLQTKFRRIAKEIHQHDSAIIKLHEELEFYNHSLAQARKKRDWWRVDHFTNLSSDIEFKLLEAKNQLEKSIDLAKYFRIWE